MSTAAIAWMATAVSMPALLEDAMEGSKQATKALKCVAFTNMQVGSIMARKRERLARRIAAVTDEIRLLKADMRENAAHEELRRAQMADIEDDMEQAHALGNAQMVLELLDELHILQEEDRREDVLLRNLKKTERARRRVRKQFLAEKRAVEDSMAVFNVKQNLIQSLLSSCSRKTSAASNTQSSSASESECGSSDRSEDSLALDLEIASSEAPCDRPPSPSREPPRSSLRWSASNSDTDSQASGSGSGTGSASASASTSAKRGRGRSVSFSPLPPTQWGADEEDKAERLFAGEAYQYHQRFIEQHKYLEVEEISSGSEGDDSDDEHDSGVSSASEDEEARTSPKALVEEATSSVDIDGSSLDGQSEESIASAA